MKLKDIIKEGIRKELKEAGSKSTITSNEVKKWIYNQPPKFVIGGATHGTNKLFEFDMGGTAYVYKNRYDKTPVYQGKNIDAAVRIYNSLP